MGTFGKIEIIDKGGWRKEFLLSKSLIYIGSDPDNDITLAAGRNEGGVPRCLQLICLPGGAPEAEAEDYIRIVNLGGAAIPLDPSSPSSKAQILHPWSAVALSDGSRFRLGDFTLVLHLSKVVLEERPLITAALQADAEEPTDAEPRPVTASDVGLELRLPETTIEVGRTLEGAVLVRNLGDQPAVQVRLALEGLDADSYELGPGPILFPNAQKEVLLRLYHSEKPRPSAGEHRISISATAPQAYPGQKAEASQVVHVAPFLAQELQFVEGEPEPGQTVAVEIHNAGNVRSRFELHAEDPDGGLRYMWSVEGEPLAGAGQSGPSAAPAPVGEPATEPGGPSMLAQVGASVRKTTRFVEGVGRVLNSVAVILPASVAAPIRRLSLSMWQGQAKVSNVVDTPDRIARQAPRIPQSQAGRLQATRVEHEPLPTWYETPFIEPGERLMVSLRAMPLRWYQSGEYTIKVTSRTGEQPGAESGAAVASVEKTTRISGLLSWHRFLHFVALLIAVVMLGLICWWLLSRA